MTNDQIEYFTAKEQQRHNLAVEDEAKRHNTASERIDLQDSMTRALSAESQREYYRGMVANGAKSAAAAYISALNQGRSAEAAMLQASAALQRVQNDMSIKERELIQDATKDQLQRELKFELAKLDRTSREEIADKDRASKEYQSGMNYATMIDVERLRQSGARGQQLASILDKMMASWTFKGLGK